MEANFDVNDEILVYGTCPDMDNARAIAKVLLAEKLVACVNILPGMVSLYRWQGAIEEGQEVVFIAKTTRDCWEEASKTFSDLHPYEVPALVALDITSGLPPFLEWIGQEVARQ